MSVEDSLTCSFAWATAMQQTFKTNVVQATVLCLRVLPIGRTAKAQCFPWSGKSFNGWVYSAIRAIAQLGLIVLFVIILVLYRAT